MFDSKIPLGDLTCKGFACLFKRDNIKNQNEFLTIYFRRTSLASSS